MKREAVQEERQKHKDKNGDLTGSPNPMTSSTINEQSLINDDLDESELINFLSDEKFFIENLIEIENNFYPLINNPVETVNLIEILYFK